MLDPKTRRFLKALQSEDGKWASKSSLPAYGIAVASLNIGHLLELNYINEIVHLEEQCRITPTGESALLGHKRAWRSDIKATIAPRRVLAPPSEAANLIDYANQACRKIIPHPPSSRK